MVTSFIHRDIIAPITNHLLQKEITLLVGPRRAGKTTIIEKIMRNLAKDGNQTFYFNLDRESDYAFFESQEKVIFFIQQECGRTHNAIYLFIDEIQRKENAGLFLKGIYDHIVFKKLQVKLVVTGSGSLELKEKIHESLAGRKRVFEVQTLRFYEFLRYRERLDGYENIVKFGGLFPEKMEAYLYEYLRYGGFPEVVLESDEQEKQERLREIYDSYVEKDIKQLLRIEKSRQFTDLVRLLAAQTGSVVNKAELARTLGLSEKTIDTYLWYLEKTFVITLIHPFYTNPRKEVTKRQVVYFHDLGLRSWADAAFAKNNAEGFVFENFIFQRVQESVIARGLPLHFWRTTLGAEVDFIIGGITNPIPIEAKMKRFQGAPMYGKSLYSFFEKYQPKNAFLYTIDTNKEETIRNTTVKTLRFYEQIEELQS